VYANSRSHNFFAYDLDYSAVVLSTWAFAELRYDFCRLSSLSKRDLSFHVLYMRHTYGRSKEGEKLFCHKRYYFKLVYNLIRVLYAGDIEVFVLFLLPGREVVPLVERVNDGSRHLKQALKDPEIEIKYVSPQAAPSDFPRTSEELAEYDVVILSDVGHDTLMLYPGEELYQIGRNRLKELRSFVEKGGGLAFCGGWLSYQGHFGHGRWYGTPVAEMLPVEILPVPDDRVETPEGAVSSIENPEHPILEGIPWGTCPVFLGYNKVGRLRQGATLLARINDDPLIAVWEYKKGRVMAFTSDPAPHWGSSFAKWEHYPRFWIRTVKWLAREI